jgi:hypothetical protein
MKVEAGAKWLWGDPAQSSDKPAVCLLSTGCCGSVTLLILRKPDLRGAPMAESEFKAGDVVQLKSGGPAITIFSKETSNVQRVLLKGMYYSPVKGSFEFIEVLADMIQLTGSVESLKSDKP